MRRIREVEHSLSNGRRRVVMKERETPNSVYCIKIGQSWGAKATGREGNSPERLLRFLNRQAVHEVVERCCHPTARLGSSHAFKKALKLIGPSARH